jgi:hypothetical protein
MPLNVIPGNSIVDDHRIVVADNVDGVVSTDGLAAIADESRDVAAVHAPAGRVGVAESIP